MKKMSGPRKDPIKQGDMKAEYRLDYGKAKPNRFATKMPPDVVAVVLEPDVAAVFKSAEAVNELLRSVISAMPESKRDRTG